MNAGMAGAASVLGIDASAAGIRQAGENARLNHLEERVRFECADVFDLLPKLEEEGERFDVVITIYFTPFSTISTFVSNGSPINPFHRSIPSFSLTLASLQERVSFECADVFDLLPKLEEEGERFDVVILDPPAFTKSRSSVKNAVKGYREINMRGLKLFCPVIFLVKEKPGFLPLFHIYNIFYSIFHDFYFRIKRLPDTASVLGIDASAAGIRQAGENARLNHLEERVRFECADVFDLLPQEPGYEIPPVSTSYGRFLRPLLLSLQTIPAP